MGTLVEVAPKASAKKIVSDWDGIGVDSGFAKIGTFFKERFSKDASIPQDLSVIPNMDHTPVDLPLRGPKEKISHLFHRRRSLAPVAEILSKEAHNGAAVTIASGRKATNEWICVSKTQVEEADIPNAEIVHTPVYTTKDKLRRINSILSKAHVIKEKEPDEVWEDNRKTAMSLARRFPNVEINYVDYGAHIKQEFLAEHPNLHVVPYKELLKKEKAGFGVSETRNSAIREKTASAIHSITKVVRKYAPGLSPTHLNIFGAFEVVAGSVVAASRDPKKQGGEKAKTAVAAILTTDGAIKDALDGDLARTIAAENPTKVNFKRGQLYDAASDRVQELSLALSRAWSANKRGDRFAELAALATATTSPWSSVSRACAEYRGKSVPEGGRGIFGLLGTRVGSAAIGELAMLYPEPKGLRVQAIADTLMTASKIVTTVDRLRTAAKGEATLSKETRAEAKTRLMVMGGFAALSLAGSLFTYMRMHRNDPEVQTKRALDSKEYVVALNSIEQYCREHGLDHRFVGGTITDWIGPQTKFNIDVIGRTVALKSPNTPTSVRSDGSVKDIDTIVYTHNQAKIKEARREFAQWATDAEARGLIFPQISMEAAEHVNGLKKSRLKQFVTAWEIDNKNIPHLVFGKVDQPIRRSSVEPWKIDLGNGTKITMLNPIAHALCYRLRVPSGVKPKDQQEAGTYDNWVIRLPYSKLSLVDGMARETISEGNKHDVDYNFMFDEWVNYIKRLKENPDLLTNIKGKITGLYWRTIGTAVAHGKIFGLSKFSDRLTG